MGIRYRLWEREGRMGSAERTGAAGLAREVAVARVSTGAGVKAEDRRRRRQTSYEFYSVTRQKPVCNG